MLLLPKKIGNYTLLRKLGTGGTAESYVGTNDAQGSRPVVVRRILPYVLRDPQRLAAIETRIQDLIGVRHPFLVHVAEHVVAGEEHFVVEEHVDGVTLDKVMTWCRQNQRVLPHNVFLNIATQVCNGLEALHGRPGKASGSEHVLHLGLKPSSVFVTRDGKVMVGGYGLTRNPTTLPQGAGPVPARLEYLSPEQTQPEQPLTPASDLFSLGSILYELLTGEALFRADSNLQTLHKVRRAEVTSQLLRVKELMPGLDKILYRTLSLNPKHRYQRAFVLREDLRGLMAGYSFAAISDDTRVFLAPLLDTVAPPHGGGLATAPDAPAGADRFDDGGETRVDPDPMTTAAITAKALAERAARERSQLMLVTLDDAPETGETEHTSPEADVEPPTSVPRDEHTEHGDDLDRPTFGPDGEREGLTSDLGAAAPNRRPPPPSEARVVPLRPLPPLAAEPPAVEATAFERAEPAAQAAPAPVVPPPPVIDAPRAEAAPAGFSRPMPGPNGAFSRPMPPPGGTSGPARPAEPRPAGAEVIPLSPARAAPPPPAAPPLQAVPPVEDLPEPAPSGRGGLIVGVTAVVALVAIVTCSGVAWFGYRTFLAPGPETVATATPAAPAFNPDAFAIMADAAPPELAPIEELPDAPADAAPPADAPSAMDAMAAMTAPVAAPATPTPATPAAAAPVATTPVATTPVATARPAPREEREIEVYTPPARTERPAPSTYEPAVAVASTPSRAPAKTPVAAPPPAEPAVADAAVDVSITEAPVSDLERHTDAAKKGKLDAVGISELEAVDLSDPQYTRSRALLLMNAQRKGDSKAQRRYLDQLMAVPENQYNPVYLTDLARWYVNSGDYDRALEKASLAERHWARLPSELVFTKKAEIYEIQAAAWQGRFYTSDGDAELLDNAIRHWERYKAHVASRSRQDLLQRADAQIAKLHDIQERLKY